MDHEPLVEDRVRCSCTVDPLGEGLWRVEVWGEFPYEAFRRTYTLEAKTDNFAAQEGLRRFVEEMHAR
jgi:hypothetical protein